ncbi:hypothetical protein RJ498_003781 [Pluralibacter gergoviae]
MNVEKKDLIIDIMKGMRNVSDYESKYGPIDICKELRIAQKDKDSESVDLFIYLAEVINYNYECLDVLNSLLIETWHEKHEDLCRVLSRFNSPLSVDYLYKAVMLELPYREYDDNYILADKCMRLIHSIGGDNAVNKLELLAVSELEEISDKAKKYLKKPIK